MTATRFTAAALTLICAGTTLGQPTQWGGWLVEVVGPPVSPSNPSTTVRVSGYFPSNLWALANGGFDLTSTDAGSAFDQVRMPPPLQPPCALLRPGTLIAGGAYGVLFDQINILGCIANSANPLAIWEATWTTQDFTPRDVQLETTNTPGFYVFENPQATLNTINLVPLNQFRHGSAVIQVIPAPAGACVILGAMALCVRRQRAGCTRPM